VGDLSAHFSRSEFYQHGTRQLVGPTAELLTVLEAIRHRIGRPLPILSGYRSPQYNRRIGGARNSQHISGRAADFREGLVSPETALAAGAVGVGLCNGWVVHVDVRPGKTVMFPDC
jgi:uncharacterized protein YcbK (DUF882 family)